MNQLRRATEAVEVEIRQLRAQLALQGSPVAGWVLLDSNLEA